MWELDYKESWVLKNWYFWAVVFEKTLESPLGSRRSNQSIIKEISLEYSLEGLLLKLKLQYFGHLMGRTDSFEKTLMLRKTEGRRRRGQQRIRWLYDISDAMDMSLQKLQKLVMDREACVLQSMGSQRVGHNWASELTSMQNECNCSVVKHFLALPFFRIRIKTDLFWSWGHCWVFQICWYIECSTLTASSFRNWSSSIGIPSLPLALSVGLNTKAHLTSHSRMSGSRWVITPWWLSGSLRPFLYSSWVLLATSS